MSEVTLSQRCLVELQQYHRSYVGDVEKPILILANSECSPEELVNKKAGYKAIPNTDRFVRADIKDGKRRGGSFEIRIPGVFNRNISSQIIAPRKHFDTSGPFSSKLDEFERELPGIESVDYSLLQLVQSPHMTKTLELAGPEKIQRIYSEIQHYLDRKSVV